MNKKVVLIGSLDTKGSEFQFVQQTLLRLGVETLVIDVGVLEQPLFPPDITSDEVARAAGTTLAALRADNDRGKAVTAMASGSATILEQLLHEDVVAAVFGMGGTAGTTVAATAMQAVPIGIPKLLVSTVASGNTRPYVGVKDIMMMFSVVDIAGLNQLSRRILSNAAYALAGMAKEIGAEPEEAQTRTTLGVTMFGVTTPCVTRVRESLEQQGYDLLVFHATGTGGMAMEQLIESGFIKGVADVTTTELADELVGGIFSAGANRLEAAGKAGIPQVISVGALDMVNFGPPDTVPERFKSRHFYQHNPTTTLMRTTVEENIALGKIMATKINASLSPTVVIFPHGGVSLLDRAGQAFDGVAERKALYQSLSEHLRDDIPLLETDKDINDPTVSDLITAELLKLLQASGA